MAALGQPQGLPLQDGPKTRFFNTFSPPWGGSSEKPIELEFLSQSDMQHVEAAADDAGTVDGGPPIGMKIAAAVTPAKLVLREGGGAGVYVLKGRGGASPLRWIPARAGMTPWADL